MKRSGCAMWVFGGCFGCLGLVLFGGWITGIWAIVGRLAGMDGVPDRVVTAPHMLETPAVALAPDGSLVTADAEGNWIFVTLPAGRKLSGETRRIPHAGRPPLNATFSADGRFLAAITGERSIEVWRVVDGEKIASLDAPSDTNRLSDIALAPSGDYVAASGWIDRKLLVWRVRDGRLLAIRDDNAYRVLGWSDNGVLSAGATFRIENERSVVIHPYDKRLASLSPHQLWGSPDGGCVAVPGVACLKLIDLAKGTSHEVKVPGGVSDVRWTPDKERIVVRFQTGDSVNGPHIRSFIQVRRTADGVLLHAMQVGTSRNGTDTLGTEMSVSGDSRWLVIRARDGALHLWDMRDWTSPIPESMPVQSDGAKAGE